VKLYMKNFYYHIHTHKVYIYYHRAEGDKILLTPKILSSWAAWSWIIFAYFSLSCKSSSSSISCILCLYLEFFKLIRVIFVKNNKLTYKYTYISLSGLFSWFLHLSSFFSKAFITSRDGGSTHLAIERISIRFVNMNSLCSESTCKYRTIHRT